MKRIHEIIFKLEHELISKGVDPERMILVVTPQILNENGGPLTKNTRYSGFYSLYEIRLELPKKNEEYPKFEVRGRH